MKEENETNSTEEKNYNIMVEATEEIQNSYAEYALHVIKQRALPDVRDGLKPVHRRVLYGMLDEGVTADKPYKKSAASVGAILGKYHPHGDQAVYDSMVRMAQDFSLRYTLVDGHGNFGSIDGDSAAAMRYTEARMSRLADEMVRDLNEDTVDWQPNYDESLKEPVVLTSRFPNLIVNGSDGIAVGMATKMPPHNLKETVNAIKEVMDNPNVPLKNLMKIIKGPDFPTAGIIVGTDGIKEYFEKGQGKITLRAKVHIEDNRGRTAIVITELPYQLSKINLTKKLAELTKDKRPAVQYLSNITDIRDESDQKTGIRLMIELKKDTNTTKIMSILFKETPLQQTYGVNNLCLVDNMPKTLNLRDLIQEYIKFQIEVIVRRTRFRLEKIKARLHILEGYIIALDPANIDEVISIIKKSSNGANARANLMKRFKLSEIQAQAVLDLRLQKLTKMDIKDIKEEYAQKKKIKAELESILKSEKKQKDIIKEDLTIIADKFGDNRKTEILNISVEDNLEEILTQVPEEEVIITLTKEGYVKRTTTDIIRNNTKGAKGSGIVELSAKDNLDKFLISKTTDEFWVLADDSNIYMNMVHEIIEQNRTSAGKTIKIMLNNLPLKVHTIVNIPSKEKENKDSFLLTVSEQGMVKRTSLDEYQTNRSSILGFQYKPGDKIIKSFIVSSSDNIVLTTQQGNTIHFPIQGNIPIQGRKSTGVIAIKLDKNDKVVGANVYSGNNVGNYALLTISEKGFGKITNMLEYPLTKKGGKGVKNATIDFDKNGNIADTAIINDSEMNNTNIYICTAKGNLIKLKLKEFSRLGRAAKIVNIVAINTNDIVKNIESVIS